MKNIKNKIKKLKKRKEILPTIQIQNRKPNIHRSRSIAGLFSISFFCQYASTIRWISQLCSSKSNSSKPSKKGGNSIDDSFEHDQDASFPIFRSLESDANVTNWRFMFEKASSWISSTDGGVLMDVRFGQFAKTFNDRVFSLEFAANVIDPRPDS